MRGSISSSRDFRRVYREGRRARRDGVTVWVARRDDEGDARLGLTVPARVGTAVARNRVRRRLRASFRAAPVPGGSDVVLRADPEVSGKSFQELHHHVVEALIAAGAAGAR